LHKYVFGPVPSRRLGRSLGINNVPPKHCTYSCIYCQLGRTPHLEVIRRSFYPIDKLLSEIVNTVKTIGEDNIDFITFVPDGEPTLDINLGRVVEKLKKNINTPIAILSNSSLLPYEDVRDDLMLIDLVSLKIDALSHRLWKIINRPHPKLELNLIVEAIEMFSKHFRGRLIYETMLVKNVNDNVKEMMKIANFIRTTRFHKIYLSIPIRPPAESWVKPPDESFIVKAFNILSNIVGKDKVELLIGFEGSNFTLTGDPIASLLAIISVHPLRLDYAYKLLEERGLDSHKVISDLDNEGLIAKVSYEGYTFIIRKFTNR